MVLLCDSKARAAEGGIRDSCSSGLAVPALKSQKHLEQFERGLIIKPTACTLPVPGDLEVVGCAMEQTMIDTLQLAMNVY